MQTFYSVQSETFISITHLNNSYFPHFPYISLYLNIRPNKQSSHISFHFFLTYNPFHLSILFLTAPLNMTDQKIFSNISTLQPFLYFPKFHLFFPKLQPTSTFKSYFSPPCCYFRSHSPVAPTWPYLPSHTM